MKVGIIGAGSIGLLFAAYLRDSFELTVYTRTSQQSKMINENGITMKKDNSVGTHLVRAVPIDFFKGEEDLLIFAVKQYQLKDLIDQISESIQKVPSLLFLQNGMGHLSILHSLKNMNIFIGSVEHGAYKENSFTVRHNGDGVTRTAVFKGSKSMLEKIISLAPTNFLFEKEANYIHMLEKKLIVNAVVNPLTAVLKVRNGLIIENPHYYELARKLLEEVAKILSINNPEWHFERIIEICSTTAENRSSMLKDLDASRKTEADSILGYLLQLSADRNINAPLINAFYHLIKGLELEKGA